MHPGNQTQRIWHMTVIFDLSCGSTRLAIASDGEAGGCSLYPLSFKLVIRPVGSVEISYAEWNIIKEYEIRRRFFSLSFSKRKKKERKKNVNDRDINSLRDSRNNWASKINLCYWKRNIFLRIFRTNVYIAHLSNRARRSRDHLWRRVIREPASLRQRSTA